MYDKIKKYKIKKVWRELFIVRAFFHIPRHINSFQIIILGFAGVILFGALLLMLPISSQSGQITSFLDSLFTSTSAVCVTGLVLYDTATYWSGFGQVVILSLIQIGGMGVITVAAAIAIISGRKISLMQRSTMQEAIAAPKVGGIVRLTGFIIRSTLLIECLGAVAMAPVFYTKFGMYGLWMACFHSISAFCNAGFDLMGLQEQYSSLVFYQNNIVINVTIMLLIVIGGMGFLTWEDIRNNGLRLRKYRMQSKVILTTISVLLLIPAIYFFFFELHDMPLQTRLLGSMFQSVTPRTAGFNTVDLTRLSEAGQFIIIMLMLIGGSPGSTAGGMKITTLAVLFATTIATFCQKEDAHLFGRRIGDSVIKHATTIFLMYISLFLVSGVVISRVESLPMVTCLFETASAIGTVGLTLGITPQLGSLSHIILIALMFFGRVGGLTLVFAAVSGTHRHISRLPQENITVG